MYATYAKLRDERGLNDRTVARETGIAPSTLYDWKAKRYTPKLDKLQKLANFFGVSLETLLEEKNAELHSA